MAGYWQIIPTEKRPGDVTIYKHFDAVEPVDAEDSIKITGDIIEQIEKVRQRVGGDASLNG